MIACVQETESNMFGRWTFGRHQLGPRSLSVLSKTDKLVVAHTPVHASPGVLRKKGFIVHITLGGLYNNPNIKIDLFAFAKSMKIEQSSLRLVGSIKVPSRPAILSGSDRNSSGGSTSIPGAVSVIGPAGDDGDQSLSYNNAELDVPIIEVRACVVPDDTERERLRAELQRQNNKLRAVERDLEAYRSPQVIEASPINFKLTDGEQRVMKLLVDEPSGSIAPCCVCM